MKKGFKKKGFKKKGFKKKGLMHGRKICQAAAPQIVLLEGAGEEEEVLGVREVVWGEEEGREGGGSTAHREQSEALY